MTTEKTQMNLFPVEDRVITLVEAARIAGLGLTTIKEARARGELRVLRLSPRRIGIRFSDFNSWLDSRAVEKKLEDSPSGMGTQVPLVTDHESEGRLCLRDS